MTQHLLSGRSGFRLMVSLLAIILLFLSVSNSIASAVSDQRARDILRMVDDLWRGRSSYAVLTMKVKTANYTRTLKLEGWSKGKEKTLIRILTPIKEKGLATLKSGNTIYSYLPKTDRTIRLTSGMMMGSWMGSHFTNDDLVKESRMEEDYDTTVSFEGKRDGVEIIEFTLIPKPEAAVVWGKVVMTVMAKELIPISQIYYDEDMAIVRAMTFSDIKMLSGKRRPAVMRVVPADKPNEYTELDYKTLDLDIPLKDELFSLTRLKQQQ